MMQKRQRDIAVGIFGLVLGWCFCGPVDADENPLRSSPQGLAVQQSTNLASNYINETFSIRQFLTPQGWSEIDPLSPTIDMTIDFPGPRDPSANDAVSV